MKCNVSGNTLARIAVIVAMTIVAIPNLLAQRAPSIADIQAAQQRAQYEQKLQQVLNNKLGYASDIVRRWEPTARTLNRWNETAATDLLNALMKLQPENLLAAGEATSYKGMLGVLSTGHPEKPPSPDEIAAATVVTDSIGSSNSDLVYTPVTPCRIVDTRVAGGQITGNTFRTFDLDGGNLSFQGGSATGCGIPFGAPSAAALTITSVNPVGAGYFSAWGLGSQPFTSVLNYTTNAVLANTTIVPDVPGGGNDFSIYSFATSDVVIDVVGYFAAPVATALDCTVASSAVTPVPVNTWFAVDASCSVGRTATGGGYDTTEGTLGYPGVWITTLPNGNGWRTWVDNQTNGARNIQTFVNCCRIPGR